MHKDKISEGRQKVKGKDALDPVGNRGRSSNFQRSGSLMYQKCNVGSFMCCKRCTYERAEAKKPKQLNLSV